MNLRAFIFDVYGTLMEVGPPPADADLRWDQLWRQMLKEPARLTRLEFSIACSKVIAQLHAAARAKGIDWPEVCWTSVVATVVPELAALREFEREEFVYRQIQTGHTVHLAQAAPEILRYLLEREWLLGICSNAQPYTVRELSEQLRKNDLDLTVFEPDLCFWSCEHGFSKPDPHVFQILSARLESCGVSLANTTMIGDRLDNDIEPARRHGWQTWHLPSPGHPGDGTWHEWLQFLKRNGQ